MPFFKSRVTSRKLTVCLFTSIVILRPFLLKMVQSFFLIRSVCLGVALETPRPSSLYRPKSHVSRNSSLIRYSKYAPTSSHDSAPCIIQIIQNIPNSINQRLSEISSDKESFEQAAPLYQNALHISGYNHTLSFSSQSARPSSSRKNRPRNVIWYNPPFSRNVATNVGRSFFKILDEEFPKNHILHKIFNRSTVKISYSCMPNLRQKINAHNKSLLHSTHDLPKSCNCREPANCPLNGNCLQSSVSFKDHKKKLSTELSKHVWKLKEANVNFQIFWKILKHATSYNPVSERCNLCLWEKYFIICRPELATLNRRNELVSSCRHARKYLLSNLIC